MHPERFKQTMRALGHWRDGALTSVEPTINNWQNDPGKVELITLAQGGWVATEQAIPDNLAARNDGSTQQQKKNMNTLEKKPETPCKKIIYKHVVIEHIGEKPAPNALLLSHGGYTMSRGPFMPGSGYVTIPNGLILKFNTIDGDVSIGTKAAHLLKGYPVEPRDVVQNGTIRNYSLEHHEMYDQYKPTVEYDLIKIHGGKAHMSDVFKALMKNNVNYEFIHSFACRINKTAYGGHIE